MRDRDAASGDSDEDAVWRDLVARFEGLVEGEQGAGPWPERENLRASVHGDQATAWPDGGPPEPGPDGSGDQGTAATGGLPERPNGSADRSVTGPTGPGGVTGPTGPGGVTGPAPPGGVTGPAPPGGVTGPAPPGGVTGPAQADDEHFVPPPAPPLPRLDPVVKGAWLALFGGPIYLLVATGAGWSVPGWAAFCAMAAFVAGFVVLVLHLGNDHRDNDSGSDDGAVV